MGIYWYCKNKGYVRGGYIAAIVNDNAWLSLVYDKDILKYENISNVMYNITTKDFLRMNDAPARKLSLTSIKDNNLECYLVVSNTNNNIIKADHHSVIKFDFADKYTYENNKFYIIGLEIDMKNRYNALIYAADIMKYDYDYTNNKLMLYNPTNKHIDLNYDVKRSALKANTTGALFKNQYDDIIFNINNGFYHTPVVAFGLNVTKKQAAEMTEPENLDKNIQKLLPNKTYDYAIIFYVANDKIYVPNYSRYVNKTNRSLRDAEVFEDYRQHKDNLQNTQISYLHLSKGDELTTNKLLDKSDPYAVDLKYDSTKSTSKINVYKAINSFDMGNHPAKNRGVTNKFNKKKNSTVGNSFKLN